MENNQNKEHIHSTSHQTPDIPDNRTESLAGLNITEGIKRMMNNRNLYISVLQATVADNRLFMTTLRNKVSTGAEDDVLSMLHRFKGATANISANPLSRQLSDLEQQYRDDGALPCTAQLTALEEEVNTVFSSIEALCHWCPNVEEVKLT